MGCAGKSTYCSGRVHIRSYQRCSSHPIPAQRICVNAPLLTFQARVRRKSRPTTTFVGASPVLRLSASLWPSPTPENRSCKTSNWCYHLASFIESHLYSPYMVAWKFKTKRRRKKGNNNLTNITSCLILAHWPHGMKTWCHRQNRKWLKYRNAVRGGPSHGHMQHAHKKLVKICSVVFVELRKWTDKQTNSWQYFESLPGAK